jgi:antibiotic biosynthesis monooxygenase (ABM) superfamily enzyme
MMIKVIVGYKLKRDADIQPILLKLVSHAMQYPGCVSAENLVSEKDSSVIAVITTWEKLENWRAWEESSIRQALLREAETLLEEAPQVTVYTIMPTVRWVE